MSQNKPLVASIWWAVTIAEQASHTVSQNPNAKILAIVTWHCFWTQWRRLTGLDPLGFPRTTGPDRRLGPGQVPTQESGSSWLDPLPWCQCPDTRTVENGRKEWPFAQGSLRDEPQERKHEERALSSFLEKPWELNVSSVTLPKT